MNRAIWALSPANRSGWASRIIISWPARNRSREESMAESMRSLLHEVADRAATYIDNREKRSVGVTDEALQCLAKFDEPLPDTPTTPEAVLALLDDNGSPATVTTAGQRFFGFVMGGSLPAALAANWLAGAWDQNAGLRISSPVAARLEDIALRWLLDLFGLPPSAGGAFVTGATMA